MKVIGRAGMAQGVKAQCIVGKLQKSVSELTLADGSDIDSIHITVILWVVHRILQWGQSHVQVVVGSPLDICD